MHDPLHSRPASAAPSRLAAPLQFDEGVRVDDSSARRFASTRGPTLPASAGLGFASLVSPLLLLGAVAKMTAIYLVLQALAGLGPVELRPRFFLAAVTFALFAVLGRLLEVGAGIVSDDATLSSRTGLRMPPIARWGWRISAILVLALQLVRPSPLPLGAALVTLALLSMAAVAIDGQPAAARRRWARAGFIAGSAGLLLYGGAVFVADFGVEALRPTSALLFSGLWLPLIAWALVRFPRIRRFGTPSVGAPMVLVVATEICVLAVADRAGLGGAYDLFVCAAAVIAVVSFIAFAFKPSRDPRRLQLPTASFLLAIDLGLVMAAAMEL